MPAASTITSARGKPLIWLQRPDIPATVSILPVNIWRKLHPELRVRWKAASGRRGLFWRAEVAGLAADRAWLCEMLFGGLNA